MKKAIHDFVVACAVCQQNKYQACSPQSLLQPLPILSTVWKEISIDFIVRLNPVVMLTVWKEISIDFIVRLPKSSGYVAILVVIDRLNKYGNFIPLKHPYSACSVLKVS